MKTVKLSCRLQALADMVTKGNTVCDVGCDHGWVSIYLVQQQIAKKVIAMDVKKGPLERAREHIVQYQLENQIETRLSDGLGEIKSKEADCMICAGMGGPLMEKILTEGREKATAMKELILQPQSEIPRFRMFLRNEGYRIVEERIIFEEGKYYSIIKAIPEKRCSEVVDLKEQLLWDTYGEILLKEKNSVLIQYLAHRKTYVEEIIHTIIEQGVSKDRIHELEAEANLIHKALEYMKI